MFNKLNGCLLAIILSLLTFYFIVPVYGQNACEGELLGVPLERNLTITSSFNPPSHYGTDYKATDGDNVLAVADGTILMIGYQVKQLPKPNPRTGLMIRGWGRYVVIEHFDGSHSLYAHLLMDSTNHLSVGVPVTKGMIIGKADSTGGVTGPHLHFEYSPTGEIFDKQSKIDPALCITSCPQTPVNITISGPDTPQNGSQYTASGGTPSYTWAISKGSITQDGVVAVSGQCGAATITVKDKCGNTATKNVRLPDGQWVQIYYCDECVGCGSFLGTCEKVVGTYRCKTNYGTEPPKTSCKNCGCAEPSSGNHKQVWIYEWQCL